MQHDSTLFFPLASRIITCLLGHAFLSLLFRSLYLFAAVVDLLLGLFQLKNFPECIVETGNSCHGVAKCSWGTFFSEIFTSSSKHFRADLKLNSPNHSDLGVNGKIFSCCTLEVI